ncbi:MAG: acyl-carrier-protein S-malonyltransferase [Candidatus Saganbacteria bacterium]|uniref:Malonyl CoA-acyl carrier protein transacylase n=1 Tax=Candidatus Saganbacteria bacterium TaxID=2575572 RepID=A0A833L0V7_UNCSA|nr:MAG: acyl-carrier-protein S-malonyltransferase [Candidatus Saganbacteria bacterium]
MNIAFVFPGQGSQFVGMGKGFAENLLEQANEILGFDLQKLCFEGPEDELKKTEIAQPAILAVSVAAYNLLVNKGIKADVVAGHSLGQYSALVAAGAIDFKDAVKVVHLRGKFMQEAVPLGEGAMSAVLGGQRDEIIKICKAIGGVQPANFNSPDQVVISGKRLSVEEVGKKIKEAGAKKIIPLQVSAPFHSELMKPAELKLKEELKKIKIKKTEIPVIDNTTAGYLNSPEEIFDKLVEQVTGSVLWEDSIRKMIGDGVKLFIEVGPGKVLSGLIKKIDPSVEVKTYAEA